MLIAYYQNTKQVIEKVIFLNIHSFHFLKHGGSILTKGGKCGALFIDLSKAFNSLQQDLFLAKLNAYGLSYKSIKLIN